MVREFLSDDFPLQKTRTIKQKQTKNLNVEKETSTLEGEPSRQTNFNYQGPEGNAGRRVWLQPVKGKYSEKEGEK